MKKILFLIMLATVFIAALPQKTEAQTSLISAGNSLARDTVTNTAAKSWLGQFAGYHSTVTIQVDITKISGTLAGSLTVVASNDGVTYQAIGSAFTVTDVASQSTNFSPTLGFRYYGVKWTGTGTMSGSLVAKLYTTRP
jgi:hypothetical protein